MASYWLANLVRAGSVRPVRCGRFGAAGSVRSAPTCSAQLFPFWFGVCGRPSGPGFDWYAQGARCDLVGQIFWCSDRGLLLGRFGIGAQLGIGERGIYYYIVVHIVN